MNIVKHFPYAVILVLLTFAGLYKSPSFAYAAVLSLGVLAADKVLEYFKERHAKLNQPLDEMVQRKMRDLEARVTTIEYGIKSRGF
jgi:hypothetical protein